MLSGQHSCRGVVHASNRLTASHVPVCALVAAAPQVESCLVPGRQCCAGPCHAGSQRLCRRDLQPSAGGCGQPRHSTACSVPCVCSEPALRSPPPKKMMMNYLWQVCPSCHWLGGASCSHAAVPHRSWLVGRQARQMLQWLHPPHMSTSLAAALLVTSVVCAAAIC